MGKLLSISVLLLGVAGMALAVPAGKVLTFAGSPMGKVIFDGKIHQTAGLKCMECHKDGMFPKMKQGTVRITMEEIYAGRLCGFCHDGKRAFAAKGDCARCHKSE
ncbi:MAG: cytochrome c3 family protein [Desulfuromonadaceae bacterium]